MEEHRGGGVDSFGVQQLQRSLPVGSARPDGDYTIRVVCEGRSCHHEQVLDLKALGQRLGFNHGAMEDDLADKFKCQKCGSRKVSFRLSPNATKKQATGTAWSRWKD